MELFSNWMFWVILAAILFILAIIGYLSESKKKSKKKEVSNETSSNNSVNNSAASVETPVQTSASAQTDDFTVMPEVKVETLNDVKPAEPTQAPATSVAQENVVTDKVPDVTPTTSSEPAAMPSSNNQNNNNVWNS